MFRLVDFDSRANGVTRSGSCQFIVSEVGRSPKRRVANEP